MSNTLVLKQFPTHIAKTDNKVKVNKFWKINSQGIYNGSIQRFTRAIVVNNMHKYIIDQLESQELPKIVDPVQLVLRIYIPINYSNVRRTSKGISWKPPEPGYVPTNDEDNISWIWNKCIKDCLTKLEVWEDDTIEYCVGTDSAVIFIDDLEDRKIEISLKNIEYVNHI
jgi:Holliday junction resolvase RusA-like endonuclease